MAFGSIGVLAGCERLVGIDAGESGTPPNLIEADRGLLGHYPGGFTVPEGETWQPIGAVTTDGSIVVRGRLRMRSGSSIQFVNVDESGFLGADDDGGPETDIGIWAVESGVLDLVGSPKRAWKRGSTRDPSWKPNDELVIGPISPGDIGYLEAASNRWAVWNWTPARVGDPVPPPVQMPDGSRIEAPVANLSQDVWIGGEYPHGRAHIISTSRRQHTIRNVQIRDMGPQKVIGSEDGYLIRSGHLGRYPLHLHKMGDASRGMWVEDVLVLRGGNHAFVTHTSHGVTHRRCVALDTTADAFWWDHGERTNDLTWDQCLAGGVRIHDSLDFGRIQGGSRGPGNNDKQASGFNLGAGHGGAAIDCRACGVTSGGQGAGFHWSGPGSDHVWHFRGNEAHNNLHQGFKVWVSGNEVRQLIDLEGNRVANCRGYGVMLGYHAATATVGRVVTKGNAAGLVLSGGSRRAAPNPDPRSDGYQYVIENHFSSDDDYGIGVDPDQESDLPTLIVGCRFDRSRVAKFGIIVPGRVVRLIDIVDCLFDGADLEPSDVEYVAADRPMVEGSVLRVQREDGTAWSMDLHDGSHESIPPFYE